MSRGRRAVILDSSAFIAGYDPSSVWDEQYSVPMVREELTEGSLPRLRFDAAMNEGRLKVMEPESKFIDEAKRLSSEVGDITYLSDVDLQVLALAIQMKSSGYSTSIVTDDYSIQNVAKRMNINFIPLTTLGIRFQLRWTLYCPACRREYPQDYKSKVCEVCGTELRRKPLSKTPIKRGTDREPHS